MKALLVLFGVWLTAFIAAVVEMPSAPRWLVVAVMVLGVAVVVAGVRFLRGAR